MDFGREVIFLCFACFSLPLKNYFYLSCILGDKESACNAEDAAGAKGLISGSGRSPGEGNGNPLQYPCLENPMDRGAWGATAHGVAKESDIT